MIRNGEYFYAIYAAAACCGIKCNYGTGVARSKESARSLGKKYEKNPVLSSTDDWTCPGHGTAVQKDGKNYFLYHGYSTQESVYAGRQGLLIKYEFTPDGWISFKQGDHEKQLRSASQKQMRSLAKALAWTGSGVFLRILKKGSSLESHFVSRPCLMHQELTSDNQFIMTAYTAETVITEATAEAGIAIIGDDKNIIFASVKAEDILLKEVKNGKTTVPQERFRCHPPHLQRYFLKLKLKAQRKHYFTFSYALGNGAFNDVNTDPVDGGFLPPWDRALRGRVTVLGTTDQSAVFKSFSLR